MTFSGKPWVAVALLFTGLMAVYCAYYPALEGGFLFDDFPNLEPLGVYGGVDNWDTFKSFVFNGFAGPTGRPISLASFLLNANNWPASPASFKLTNLHIHALCGLLLIWATLYLLRLLGYREQWAAIIAVANGGIWLLHPYMVSTAMYVVQRMAQLAFLFMFAGLTAYLYGRLQLTLGKVKTAYSWMSAGLTLGTLLAVLSKENGALLPLLALVIEACLPVDLPKLHRYWRAVFLWGPALLVTCALLSKLNLAADAWPARPFNQVERLMSESRILWQYLYDLYIPKFEGAGLFRDGIAISRGLFQPWSTALALLMLLAVGAAAWIMRRRWPLFSLAILFFGVSHLMESTVIGLELYFEHRNYVAAALLFLPLVSVVVEPKARKVAFLLVFVSITLLGWMTWERAKLWSDSSRLQTYWAINAQDSPRAHNHLAVQLFNAGKPQDALAKIKMSMEQLPGSSLLVTNFLMTKLYLGQLTETDVKDALRRLQAQNFDGQALMAIRSMMDSCADRVNPSSCSARILELVAGMDQFPQFTQVAVYNRLSTYVKARMYLAEGDVEKAIKAAIDAIKIYQETDMALNVVAVFARSGYYDAALALLEQAKEVYSNQDPLSLKRSTDVYDLEFPRLESEIIQSAKIEKVKE